MNLFIASELDWKERGIKVRQETEFPITGTTKLTFTCEKPVDLELRAALALVGEERLRGVRQRQPGEDRR